jgi:cell division protein FtsI (penicillin-binding protein 3)
LGFGRRTGVPVPFEAAGIVTPLKRWTRNYTLVSVSFGQEIAVTALQMAAGISTLADGLYRPPRLITACSSEAGRSVRFEQERPRPVFTRDLVDSVRGWMADSVRFGSCAALKLPGMPVAGKTGTATSETDPTQETHSFAALAPALDPVIALVVVVHEPNGVDFASQSAAPAAGHILSRLMPYLGYPIE